MSNLIDNSLSAAKNSIFYDQFWKELSNTIAHDDLLRVSFLVDSIREFTGRRDLQILDLGCGRGWMAPFLSQFGSVTGIDFSPIGIQFAQEQYGKYGTFILADPNSPKLGLPDDSKFDVVVCSEVLEHVHNHMSLLNQIREFLLPNGWCMLTTPNGNIWPEFSLKTLPQQLQPIENWVTTNELSSLLHDVGFQILCHEGRIIYGLSNIPKVTNIYRKIEKLVKVIGLQHFYGRRILPISLYQMVAVQLH